MLTMYERAIEAEILDALQMMNERYPGFGLVAFRYESKLEPPVTRPQKLGWSIIELKRGGSARVGWTFYRLEDRIEEHWLNEDQLWQRETRSFDEVGLHIDMTFEAFWHDEYKPFGGAPQPPLTLPGEESA